MEPPEPEVDLVALKDESMSMYDGPTPTTPPSLERDWEWIGRDGWTQPVDNEEWRQYQQFYDTWRGATIPSEFETKLPYVLSLVESPPAYIPDQPSILVTETYEKLLHRILCIRRRDAEERFRNGILLTGQPGTGKSIFLKFVLVRLIAAKQVVVLYDNDVAWLFYDGKVYRSLSQAFRDLPKYRKGYFPVWALIDMDLKTEPPLSKNKDVWPIQAASPDPKRWKSWVKYYEPRQLGMPLWTEADLVEGLRLHPGYVSLRARLRAVFDGSESHDERIKAMMKIFRTEVKAKAEAEGEAGVGMEADDAPPAAQDVDMPDTDRNQPAWEKWASEVFEASVRDTIEEFGPIPREVYGAITGPSDEKENRDREVKELTYLKLQQLVHGFSRKKVLDASSHCVVAVYPTTARSPFDSDKWEINFKSPWIWTAVKNQMQLVEDEHLRETVGYLRRFSEGSTLAGRIFEVAANHVLSRGGSALEPIAMKSQNDPPLFSGRTDLPSSSPRPSFTTTRIITMIDLSKELTEVTLDGDRYYVPISSNHPLFDAFTIDLVDDKTALISVLQTTISQPHGGSANGYLNIRKIMIRVRKLFEEREMDGIKLKVAYVLVCPEDETEHTWQMPGGWDKEISKNDHRGQPFCVRITGFSDSRRTAGL